MTLVAVLYAFFIHIHSDYLTVLEEVQSGHSVTLIACLCAAQVIVMTCKRTNKTVLIFQFEPAAITWDEETKKPKAGTEFGVEGRSVSDVGELKKRVGLEEHLCGPSCLILLENQIVLRKSRGTF